MSQTVELQPRDFKLLCGLFESRLFTLDHLAALFFSGKRRMARKRIEALRDAGYINQRPRRRASDPATFSITKQSYEVLHAGGYLEGYPKTSWPSLERRVQVSEQTLLHELAVLDVKAALLSSLAPHRFSITQFTTWPLLAQFEALRPTRDAGGFSDKVTPMRPDGYAHLTLPTEPSPRRENHLFLEVERSSKSLHVPISKCHGYQNFYHEGGLAVRLGDTPDNYKNHPFRALFVLPNEERRNNLAARILSETSIGSLIWISTLPEVLSAPLGRIWVRPRDYLAATQDTSYDPHAIDLPSNPVRNPSRDRFVSERIEKQSLFKTIGSSTPPQIGALAAFGEQP